MRCFFILEAIIHSFTCIYRYIVYTSFTGGICLWCPDRAISPFLLFRIALSLFRSLVVSQSPCFALPFRCSALSLLFRTFVVLYSRYFVISLFQTFVVSHFRCFVLSLFHTFVVLYLVVSFPAGFIIQLPRECNLYLCVNY